MGPGAPRAALLQTSHLSWDVAFSGVLFPLRSLRTPSTGSRRARRAPRPQRRSAMAKAKSGEKARESGHLTALQPRGIPGSRSFAEKRLLWPAPPRANSAPPVVHTRDGEPVQMLPTPQGRGCALQESSFPIPVPPPTHPPAPLSRSLWSCSWLCPCYFFRPPEAPGAHRVAGSPQVGLHEVGRKREAWG